MKRILFWKSFERICYRLLTSHGRKLIEYQCPVNTLNASQIALNVDFDTIYFIEGWAGRPFVGIPSCRENTFNIHTLSKRKWFWELCRYKIVITINSIHKKLYRSLSPSIRVYVMHHHYVKFNFRKLKSGNFCMVGHLISILKTAYMSSSVYLAVR